MCCKYLIPIFVIIKYLLLIQLIKISYFFEAKMRIELFVRRKLNTIINCDLISHKMICRLYVISQKIFVFLYPSVF